MMQATPIDNCPASRLASQVQAWHDTQIRAYGAMVVCVACSHISMRCKELTTARVHALPSCLLDDQVTDAIKEGRWQDCHIGNIARRIYWV